jgi:ankyrin repeat protein
MKYFQHKITVLLVFMVVLSSSAGAFELRNLWTSKEEQLLNAIKAGDLSRVEALAADHVNPNAILDRSNDRTALMVASSEGYTNIVNALLKSGAEVNKQNSDGWSALMIAARNGHINIVQALLNAGASVHLKTKGHDKYYWTALHTAVLGGHTDVVRLLLKNGADINGEGSDADMLELAASEGHLDTVRLLLSSGADPRKNYTIVDAARKSPEIQRLLLQAGAPAPGSGVIEEIRIRP